MKSPICDMLGIDFPLLAFSHCRDVVAAVSAAGGFGVLGASSHTPDQLEFELRWIDEHVGGKPYGVDLLIPENLAGRDERASSDAMRERVPRAHRDFVRELMARHDMEFDFDDPANAARRVNLMPDTTDRLLEVAFSHPIRLIANALGVPPPAMLARGKRAGVPVAALVGAKEHAVRQVQAGVDLVVAQGGEAGGHCGEVSTLVLVPEVLRAIRPIRQVPVLAAGGIVTGAQMAAMMALGAAGAWTGSVWLMTAESEVSAALKEKFAAAGSRDTVRSKSRTGKPSRQLRSAWTDAWEAPGNPGTLPMPLQIFLSDPSLRRADAEANRGNARAREMATYFVGQGVGLLDGVKSTREVVREFMEDFAAAAGRLNDAVAD
jgi:NAD(P)H-dependent flavin oxidoreductase YrpB (nitropropane dioxygenase family)